MTDPSRFHRVYTESGSSANVVEIVNYNSYRTPPAPSKSRARFRSAVFSVQNANRRARANTYPERSVKVTPISYPALANSADGLYGLRTERTDSEKEDEYETESESVDVIHENNTRNQAWQNISRTARSRKPERNYDEFRRKGKHKKLEHIYEEFKRTGKLYEDDQFPADDSSLFIKERPAHAIEWRRPWEIVRNPKFFNGELNQHDVVQGSIKNCWLVSAIATLALHKELLYKVCPPNQSFEKQDYCGAFLFRFWHFGEWIDVIVDDRLPTYKNGQLYFARSRDSNEFWSALLEKAYCKIYENYESLNLGRQSEALQDFTGGVVESLDLSKSRGNLFHRLKKIADRNSLMGSSIEVSKARDLETRRENGLVVGHAYSITGLNKVTLVNHPQKPQVELIRLRNPWGNDAEWKLAWSDRSPEWDMLSSEQRKRMGLVYENDGEFWMSLEDFADNFSLVEICMLSPKSMKGSDKTEWHERIETGRWKAGHNAGGCRNFGNTFHLNPQLRIKLEEPDSGDDENNGKGSVVIELMRKMRHRNVGITCTEGHETPPIGFTIYKCPQGWPEGKRLDRNYFRRTRAVTMTRTFTRHREIKGRFELSPGEYVIIPSTLQPNQEANFLLRIFTEKHLQQSLVDHETKLLGPVRPFLSPEVSSELDDKLLPLFKMAAGEDSWIDQVELRRILNRSFANALGSSEGFSLDMSRSMIAMFDIGKDGTLTFPELKELWQLMKAWQETFDKFDNDNSGDMDIVELRDALQELNFSLSNTAMEALVARYNNKSGRITFDTFVHINIRLIRVFELAEENMLDRQSMGKKKFVFTGLDENEVDLYRDKPLPAMLLLNNSAIIKTAKSWCLNTMTTKD